MLKSIWGWPKKWFRTVGRRLFVKLLLFVIVPNLLLVAIIHQLMMRQMESKIAEMDNTLTVLEHAAGREITALFNHVITLTNLIIIESDVQGILSEGNSARAAAIPDSYLELKHYQDQKTIRDILSRYRIVWNDIYDITLIDNSGEIYVNTARNYTITRQDLAQSKLMHALASTDSPVLSWSVNDALTKNEDMITIARKIYGVNHPEQSIGYVVVNISLNAIRDSFHTYNYYDQMIFGLVNQSRSTWMVYNGNRIVGGDGALIHSSFANGLSDMRLMGKHWRMSLRQTATGDFVFVGLDADFMKRQAAEIRNGLYYSYAFFLVLAFFISVTGARAISARLGELAVAMRKFGQKQWGTRIRLEGNDEIGMIGKQFNRMASHIEQLLKDVREQQRRKRIFELRVLEYQINPHFLYNTLDSIHWLAFEEGQTRISEMVGGLSKLFRLILSKGKETIPLEQEFEMVRIYLNIQKIRFEDRFDYEIRLSPEVAPFPVGKLVLQPLVENALVHGIRKLQVKGKIEIIGERRGDTIHLEISDNGEGMPPEQMERLKQLLHTDPLEEEAASSSGYGMKNVDSRLKLMYGNRYRMELNSGRSGTTIRIRIREGEEPTDSRELSV